MKTLIAVASKHGATAEMGQIIAQELESLGIETVLSEPAKVTSLAGTDCVVLGSGIYVARLLPAVTALAYRWSDWLLAHPVYLFGSGPLDASAEGASQLPYEARQLARLLGARSAKLFGGRLDISELRPTERALIRMSGAPPGDYRDLDSVRRWAREIGSDMLSGS
jgi:menaquinone-dependent protoporphyrinogen oxidase